MSKKRGEGRRVGREKGPRSQVGSVFRFSRIQYAQDRANTRKTRYRAHLRSWTRLPRRLLTGEGGGGTSKNREKEEDEGQRVQEKGIMVRSASEQGRANIKMEFPSIQTTTEDH